MMEKNLPSAFSDSLSDEITGSVAEFAELGLDSILEDGLLKDIPLVSTVVSLFKIGKSIHERHCISKLAVFLNEINKGIADEEKRQEYRQKIREDEKTRNKELEYVLVLIDRYISYDKPQMLAKLYLAYLDGVIVWEEFSMYAEVIDRFLLLDCRTLVSEADKIIVLRNIGGESVQRLVALGLMKETSENSVFKEERGGGLSITPASMQRFISKDRTFRRTEFGEKLAKILR